ncbi:protein FAM177A1-like [Tachysurus ichikawai]
MAACDYVGERMASMFGITSAKYQYAIDEYNRTHKQTENEDGASPVSEEAESHFVEKVNEEIQEKNIDKTKLDHTKELDTESPPEPEKLHTDSFVVMSS